MRVFSITWLLLCVSGNVCIVSGLVRQSAQQAALHMGANETSEGELQYNSMLKVLAAYGNRVENKIALAKERHKSMADRINADLKTATGTAIDSVHIAVRAKADATRAVEAARQTLAAAQAAFGEATQDVVRAREAYVQSVNVRKSLHKSLLEGRVTNVVRQLGQQADSLGLIANIQNLIAGKGLFTPGELLAKHSDLRQLPSHASYSPISAAPTQIEDSGNASLFTLPVQVTNHSGAPTRESVLRMAPLATVTQYGACLDAVNAARGGDTTACDRSIFGDIQSNVDPGDVAPGPLDQWLQQ